MPRKRHDSSSSSSDSDSGSDESSSDSDRQAKKSKKQSKSKTKKEKKHKKSRKSDNSETDDSDSSPVKKKVQSKVQKAKVNDGNKNDRRRNISTSESSPEKRQPRNRQDSNSRENRNSRNRRSSLSPSLNRQDTRDGDRNRAGRGGRTDKLNQMDKSNTRAKSAEMDSFDARDYRQKSPVRNAGRSPMRQDDRRPLDSRIFPVGRRDKRVKDGRNMFQEDGGRDAMASRNPRVFSPERRYGRDQRPGPRNRQSPDRRGVMGDRGRNLSDSRDMDERAGPRRAGNRDRSPKPDGRDRHPSPRNYEKNKNKRQQSSRSPDRHGDRRSNEKSDIPRGKKKKSDRSKSPHQRSNSKELLSPPKKSREAVNEEGTKGKKDKQSMKRDRCSDSSPEPPKKKAEKTDEGVKDGDKSRSKDKSKAKSDKKKKRNEMKFRSKRPRSSSSSSAESEKSEGSKKVSSKGHALSEERKTKKLKSDLNRSSPVSKHDIERDYPEERDPMEEFVKAKVTGNKKAKSLTPVPISKLNKSAKSKSQTPESSKIEPEPQHVSPSRKQLRKVSPARKNTSRNKSKSISPSPHDRSATSASEVNLSKSSNTSFGRDSELNRSSDMPYGVKHDMAGYESEADSGPESGELTDSDTETKTGQKPPLMSLVNVPDTEPVSDTEDIERTTLPASLSVQKHRTETVDEAPDDPIPDVDDNHIGNQREPVLDPQAEEDRQKRLDEEFWVKKHAAKMAGADGEGRKRKEDEEYISRKRGSARNKDDKRAERSRKEEKENKRKRKNRDEEPKKMADPIPAPEPAPKKSRMADAGVAALTGRTGGAYIPPARLRAMQADITDKTSVAYQRISWEALKKSINGLVNKVNVSNIIDIVKEMFQENIVRGRGLMSRSIIQAQSLSPTFTHVYAALVAIINTKFPQNGELILRRVVIQFRRGFKRNDKALCLSTTRFIGHLVNQQVAHEVVALEILTLLLETPSDDAVEVAIGFLKECGQKLTEVSPRGINAIFERLRNILHEGQVDTRVEYMIEVMFAIRKDGFKDHQSVLSELDLVIEEDQFTHLLTLEDAGVPEDMLNIFRPDPDFGENEEKYKVLKKEILDEGSSDSDESGGESGSGSEDSDEEENEAAKQLIIDSTETNLVALRRTIYLTIQSSLDFEECAHKLMKMDLKPGQEVELCNMILDCCAQMRTYEKFYGLLAQRFCMIDRKFIEPFQRMYVEQYETIHRLETNKLRNVAKFFAHLLHTDGISWQVMSCIRLNEEDTSSASRIFIKILFQELSEYMGLPNLNDRLKDPTLQEAFVGLLPRDNPRDTRFAINFFTTVGLGGLTDDLRDHLKSVSKKLMQQKEEEVVKSDSDSSSSSSSSSDGSGSSDDSSDSDNSDSDSSEDDKRKKKQVETKKKGKDKQKGKDKNKRQDKKRSESPDRLEKSKRKGDKYSEKYDSRKDERKKDKDNSRNDRTEKGGRSRDDREEERLDRKADKKKNKDYTNGSVGKGSRKKDKKKNKGDADKSKKTALKLFKMANYDTSNIDLDAKLDSRDRGGKMGKKEKGGKRDNMDVERFEDRGDGDRGKKGKRDRVKDRLRTDDGGDRQRGDRDRDLYDVSPQRDRLPGLLDREIVPYDRRLSLGDEGYLDDRRRPPPPRYRDEIPPLMEGPDPRVERRIDYVDLYEDRRRDDLYEIERERDYLERELLYQRELDEYERRERLPPRREPRYGDSFSSGGEYDHPPLPAPLPPSPVKGLSPRKRSELNRHGEVIVPLPRGGGRRLDDFPQFEEVQDEYNDKVREQDVDRAPRTRRLSGGRDRNPRETRPRRR